jgi:hypothetical protein
MIPSASQGQHPAWRWELYKFLFYKNEEITFIFAYSCAKLPDRKNICTGIKKAYFRRGY